MDFRVRVMMDRHGRNDAATVREEIERFDAARARTLRAEGWITVAALLPAVDWPAEARRLDCGFVLDGGEPRAVAA